MAEFYDHVNQMEPMLPNPQPGDLLNLSIEVIRKGVAPRSVEIRRLSGGFFIC